MKDKSKQTTPHEQPNSTTRGDQQPVPPPSKEIGGPRGPEPTRYGDWERGGRCIDF